MEIEENNTDTRVAGPSTVDEESVDIDACEHTIMTAVLHDTAHELNTVKNPRLAKYVSHIVDKKMVNLDKFAHDGTEWCSHMTMVVASHLKKNSVSANQIMIVPAVLATVPADFPVQFDPIPHILFGFDVVMRPEGSKQKFETVRKYYFRKQDDLFYKYWSAKK